MAKLSVFKREWLKDLKIIKSPMNKVELTVAHSVNERNYLPPTEPGKSGKYIVTLKAVTHDKLEELKALFKHREEVPIEETNGLFLTATIWRNDETVVPDLPIRGEKILCNVNYVWNKERTMQLLRVVGDIKLQKTTSAESIDMDTFFDDVETQSENVAATTSHDDIVHS